MCVLVYVFLTVHHNILAPPALMVHQILGQVCINMVNTKENDNILLLKKRRRSAVTLTFKERDVILEEKV